MSQIAALATSVVHYDPDCTREAIAEVRSFLERLSQRTAAHVSHLRQHQRFEFPSELPAEVIVTQGDKPISGEPGTELVFHMRGRNVSQSGMGFIAPPVFVPRLLSDTTPVLRTEAIFTVERRLTVVFKPLNGRGIRADATVVRRRVVPSGFFELGVKFIQVTRVDS